MDQMECNYSGWQTTNTSKEAAMLTISNFSKSYNGTPVIRATEIILHPGIYWLKGENGSGKTSFFKSLAGLLPHDGNITFDDSVSLKKNPREYRLRVNYSEAEPLYPGFLTAKDLLHFIGKAKQASTSQQDLLINKFGISTYLHNTCETYSSGMLKKLSLALAFLGNPQVIILDEPLITLDDKARSTLFDQINLLLEKDVIFIISSHQLIETISLEIKGVLTIANKEITQI